MVHFLPHCFRNSSISGSPKPEIHVLALVPSYFGYGGVTNERQLLNSLSTKVNSICVVTLVGFSQLTPTRKCELKIDRPLNMTIVPVPIPQINHLLVAALSVAISFVCASVASIFTIFGKLNIIYIRTSWLSPGFMLTSSLRRITIVKLPAVAEDEITDHSPTSGLARKLSRFLDKLAITKSKRTAVPNPLLGEFLAIRKYPRPEKPWLVLPAGVDLKLIEKVKRSSNMHKHKSDDYYKIGFVGSLVFWQGVDLLVQAVFLAKKKMSNIELLIVGDGPMREKVRKVCEACGVRYSMTGFVSHEEALNYLKDFDALVLPRRKSDTTESIIPIKIVEAFALGVPIIVTPHRALVDMFRDREDLLYAEPNPEDIANKIILLRSDEKMRKRISRRGPMIARNFNYARITDTLIESLRNHCLKTDT